ncbi:MAG: hypothetical protein KKA07_14635 [Bacteroidetes bacterium]|nr:hypothetical protein [Bacteroidota bacterium]MBU1720297.1 hypothetical protein [Bacteroidota bacterium]
MKHRYRKLFEIAFSHEYFSDGKLNSLSFTPVASTARFLQNQRMQLRQIDNSCAVLFENIPSEPDYDPVIPVDFPIDFVFAVSCKDPNLPAFTEMPLFRIYEQTAFLSNANHETGASFLSESEFFGEKDVHIRYSPKIKLSLPAGDISVKDIFGNIVFSADYFPDIHGEFPLPGNFTPGLYTLFHNNIQQLDYVVQATGIKNLWGLIHIRLDEQSLDSLSNNSFPSFSVNFRARKTHWLYTVIPGRKSVTDIHIVDETDQVRFTPIQVSEGAASNLHFISDQPVVLRERYQNAFKLSGKLNGSASSRTLIEKLPYPETQNMLKSFENFDGVSSQIFAHL